MTSHGVVHHLAHVGKASAAFGILCGTLASTGYLLGDDPLHDDGFTIYCNILLNVGGGVAKAITYQAFHSSYPPRAIIDKGCQLKTCKSHVAKSSSPEKRTDFFEIS